MHATDPLNAVPRCAHDFRHPLEVIAFFRRFRPGIARDLLYTVIWNSLFALFFTAVSLLVDPKTTVADSLRITFVFAQCIGFVRGYGQAKNLK